ncbi:unnamed protein product [Didymodactylos carnosus]|uniref:Integrase catalytic domain-containing protein n=1 Tax=Didymodactylos carnosus TaxID=1234261 RepID=A0A815BFR4_9BILA|nr:unnamed protein product [Didymodactylos carnosus]CAF4055939.1 unnamed protein product [Didymodactylos carnosus]
MLQLDACDYGLGAVLTQNIERREHVIAYAGRTLQPCEKKYSAPELVPKPKRLEILQVAHGHPISGHIGRLKTLHRISIRFFREVLHDEVICRHGVPVKTVSDNGAQFVAEIFRETLKIMGIQHRTTALYHPQSNLSERVNKTLKPMLAIFSQNDKESWDIRLPQLALAIRAAINESTGQTPAFLMYGLELKLPLDLIYDPEVDVLDELRSSDEVRAYTERLKAILESVHESAKENLEITRENQKLS